MKLVLVLAVASIAQSATGNAVIIGAPIDDGASASGHAASAMFDGDNATYWGSASTATWAGVDAGSSVTALYALITPRIDSGPACGGPCWDRGLGQSVIEASNASNFAGAVVLDALHFQPLISQYLLNRRPLAPGSAYRYYRVRTPSGFGDVAEFRIVSTVAGVVTGRPVAPAISPWGGVALSGVSSVTLSSETTSAAIHWTSDGSDATCNSTLYSGPISIAVAFATSFSAVACDDTLSLRVSEISRASFRNYAWGNYYTPDYDSASGNQAQTYAGGIFGPVAGRYYQTGMWMYSGPCGQLGPPAINPCSSIGTWLYSSPNLMDWSLEGQILDDGTTGGKTWTQVQRSHAVRNAITGKWVMWSHCQGTSWIPENSRACIATADTPTGQWTWTQVQYDPGHGYRDCTLFVDRDGTGYTIATDGFQTSIWIYKLASDYLTVHPTERLQVIMGGFESPVMFRRDSAGQAYYYLIYGGTTFFGSQTDAYYIVATDPLGTWSAPIRLYPSGPPTGYGGQPTFIYEVPGLVDTWMLGADLWGDSAILDRPQRNRLIFSTDAPPVMSVDMTVPWDLSTAKSKLFPLPGPGRTK